MEIRYDEDADALYIKIVNREGFRTEEKDENTILDYDKDGNIIGLEFLFVKERMPEFLKSIKKEKIIQI